MSENALVSIQDTSVSPVRCVLGWIVVAFAVSGYPASAAEPVATAKVAAPSDAIAGQTVKATLTQFKVVKNSNGSEKLEDAARVKPGDILEYRVTYTNVSSRSITGLTANLPIPMGLAYQARSATPAADRVRVAAADGRFSTEPLSQNVNGKTVPVPYQDYRQIRWTLGQLPAGGSVAVTARAQVESVVASALAPPGSSVIPPTPSAAASPTKR